MDMFLMEGGRKEDIIIIGEGGFCGLWSFILHGSLGRERE